MPCHADPQPAWTTTAMHACLSGYSPGSASSSSKVQGTSPLCCSTSIWLSADKLRALVGARPRTLMMRSMVCTCTMRMEQQHECMSQEKRVLLYDVSHPAQETELICMHQRTIAHVQHACVQECISAGCTRLMHGWCYITREFSIGHQHIFRTGALAMVCASG